MNAADHPLQGSITPLITPFKGDGIDFDTYASLVRRHIEAGGHGVLVNGTSAEPSTLTIAERNQLVDVAIEAAAGQTTVVAATGSQSFAETCALTEHATKAGADALLVVTPYYLRPPQRGLVEYYAEVGRRTDLPLLIYHIPGRAAVTLELATLEAIAKRTPTFCGMKHASVELGLVSDCLRTFGDSFRIFVGLEELSLPMLALGACGVMNAVGNLVPKRIAALCEAILAGDLERARKHHYELLDLNRAVFWDTNPIPIKYLARQLGIIPSNEHRLPMAPPDPTVAKRLDALLASNPWLRD
ncbi:MAG: 4-hydroxy-tetrahydrodipicolinate synthase [Gammaproteobacteria bacterium]|nr:MAG: 4-hydroxy-tetrahydrodipicolinate synthase [Gammaproteobacteria bacterium]